ncbi:hypothetical protein [uncultured Tateyamaria sp.]|uniref:hypothetical protein n=1 Tax=uncultured Tateyamaria sp. TaxID=455651 RepID=UPI002601B817|nr:hypothetical protein [uncultured Tateyamaria sp.]
MKDIVERAVEPLGTDDKDPYTRPIRLPLLRDAQHLTWRQRAQLKPIKLIGGGWPNPHLVLSHKRKLFGEWFANFTQRSMRQSDYWKKEELELFGAFTANQLACSY